jgi:hypothetical protein
MIALAALYFLVPTVSLVSHRSVNTLSHDSAGSCSYSRDHRAWHRLRNLSLDRGVENDNILQDTVVLVSTASCHEYELTRI